MMRSSRSLGWTAAIAWTVTVVLASAQVVAWVTDKDVWSPLGPYPPQRVLNVQPISLETVEHVDVVGTKCADDNTPIEGVVRWQSVTPGGVIVVAATGSAIASPTDASLLDKFGEAGGTVSVDDKTGRRCFTRLYENQIPTQVAADSRRWIGEGRRVAWIITGTETPSDGDRQGLPVVWSSEPFEIVE